MRAARQLPSYPLAQVSEQRLLLGRKAALQMVMRRSECLRLHCDFSGVVGACELGCPREAASEQQDARYQVSASILDLHRVSSVPRTAV